MVEPLAELFEAVGFIFTWKRPCTHTPPHTSYSRPILSIMGFQFSWLCVWLVSHSLCIHHYCPWLRLDNLERKCSWTNIHRIFPGLSEQTPSLTSNQSATASPFPPVPWSTLLHYCLGWFYYISEFKKCYSCLGTNDGIFSTQSTADSSACTWGRTPKSHCMFCTLSQKKRRIQFQHIIFPRVWVAWHPPQSRN